MTDPARGLGPAFSRSGSSSFFDFLMEHAPQLLPGSVAVGPGEGSPAAHATTIVAVTFAGGAVMAGDRRATMGSHIASSRMEKVFPADDWAAVGIAGSAGIGVELVRLFQLELEHYEKIEGAPLTLEGKANRLATLLRGNLPLAVQGFPAVPLLAGFDTVDRVGRIFSYDVTGGRYEEQSFHSVGSGAVFARGSLKKRWRPGLDLLGALMVVVEALFDAADDDSATAGPDLEREIWPVIASVTEAGYAPVASVAIADCVERVRVSRRRTR